MMSAMIIVLANSSNHTPGPGASKQHVHGNFVPRKQILVDLKSYPALKLT